MEETPRVDPSGYLMKQIQHYRFFSNLAPSDVRTPLKKLLFLVESMVLSDMEIAAQIRGNVSVYLDSLKKPDGGFGMERATLVDTWYAISILSQLHCRFDVDEVETFINACEEPESGFVGIPGSSLSSIEAIHAGIAASRTLSRKPVYLDRCLDFIRYCQRNNGGFARSSGGGIATLENSHYAATAFEASLAWTKK